MGFSRQEDWSGLPCPPPGDIADPEIESAPPVSPTLQADSLLLESLGKPTPAEADMKTEVVESCNTGIQTWLLTPERWK